VSDTATVLVESITEKHGETNGKAWTNYVLKDGNGNFYSTFDRATVAPILGADGKRALIEYEIKGKFKNLSKAELVQESSINGRTPEGDADWDVIGLRKTRCVLWEALLPIAMQAGISGFTKAMNGEYDSGQLGGFVARFGKALRQIAEADIYLEDPVENSDEWIPFLKPPRKPQGDEVPI